MGMLIWDVLLCIGWFLMFVAALWATKNVSAICLIWAIESAVLFLEFAYISTMQYREVFPVVL